MLTLQTKKRIDLVVPTLAAFAAAAYAFKKGRSDWRTMIVVLLGVFIVAYIVTTQVTKTIYSQGPPQLPVGKDAQSYDGLPMATRVFNDTDCFWCFRDVQLYKDILALTDGQLLQVENSWRSNFHSKNNESMREAINAEFSSWSAEFYPLRDALNNRFDSLGI